MAASASRIASSIELDGSVTIEIPMQTATEISVSPSVIGTDAA